MASAFQAEIMRVRAPLRALKYKKKEQMFMGKLNRIQIPVTKTCGIKSATEVMWHVAPGLYPAIEGSIPSCRI